MSDTQKRYREVRKALDNLYPSQADGHQAQHLNTLTALICGIVGSQKTNLPQVASKAPANGVLRESLIKRFSRLINNDKIDQTLYFLPYTQALISCLSHLDLTLVIDGSAVGRNCVALVISLVYKKRALPIAFLVRTGSKGHFSEKDHQDLVERVYPLLPQTANVTFLGDGEFDGVKLLERLDGYGWHYVCRTAKNSLINKGFITFQLQERSVKPGCHRHFENIYFTSDEYGPIHAIIWWEKGYEDPLYLITNIPKPEVARFHYRKRFRIETFFSDQKSRGFHLHKSHLSDPQRIERLMIPACLAYIWVVYLGIIADEGGYVYLIHRSDRCDLSWFQIGLRLIDHFFNEDKLLPHDFHIWRFEPFNFSVRY
jgi:hypothetical protein